MASRAFLDELNKLLRKLPYDDRKEILYDYEEHIRIAAEQGITDGELLKRLGDPKTIAKAIMAEYYLGLADETRSPTSIFRAIAASVSLGFFNFIIVFPPTIAFLAVFLVLYIVSWVLLLSPIFGVYCLIQGYGWSAVFASLLTLGIGIFLFMASSWTLKKIFTQWIGRYLKFNIRIAKGGS
ncbi:HAAS signaling domain-containing protein [Alicyclobacillus fastidiosus]|uniref:DUF1700 domain-containing protein n=1 Tax=Alicyclobacillus fastidiosus TaxID=392011 RepID=A0ABV5AB38_9BACL|nr:DUF1700 domain-containing protein [Alicyclobacillus fastidiosus]WEH10547.1 DUF1700 domain-containing protein [Alicyclobacillus fastidiosus]